MKTCSYKQRYALAMGHIGDSNTASRLDAATAKQVATTLQALATPSRLMILSRLQEGPTTVTDLATAVGMEQSAVSHQLRLLRNLGLVEGKRRGRTIEYSLYDDHVTELIAQAVYHAEHVQMGMAGRATAHADSQA
jgi:DNA-binding transcriptional ArsR family regulator